MSSIARAVGGEFPISEEQFHLWNSPPASAIDAVETRFGVKSAGLWLTFGRNALGVALDFCGVSADATLAMPAYQCGAVVRKIASRTQNWRFYATDEALNPVIDDFMNQVQGVRAVLTTVYFGAPLIETHLTELAEELYRHGESPWIIEDRVMCPPVPLAPDVSRRCDFAIMSFRKHYPVPDGALLLACSDRADKKLREFDRKNRIRRADAPEHALLTMKISAKRKRAAWVAASPIIDDADLNGLRESIDSEDLLERWTDTPEADYVSGSSGSACVVHSRDVASDRSSLERKAESVLSSMKVRQWSALSLPLVPGPGIGVPLWSDRRDAIRTAVREQGVFLPVHWPEHGMFPLASNYLKWHQSEVTLPTYLHFSDRDERYMVDTIFTADSICIRT